MQRDEIFAEAVERLLAGEPIDQIAARYPAALRVELRGMLSVVELAEQVAAATPPRSLPANRLGARLAFAQRAAELRAERGGGQASAVARPPAAFGGHWLRTFGAQPAWRPLFRLAPLTLLLAMLYLLTFVVVATAQESLPDDLVYPMKMWILEQRVATAPAEERAAVRWQADASQAEDVARLAEELQVAQSSAKVTAVSYQQFRGFDGEQLLIGDLKVIPWYQTEAGGSEEWLPLTVEGELLPGADVMLRYQVVPGASDVVQGMVLRLVRAPQLPTPLPSPTPVRSSGCQRLRPAGWVEYIVRSGETLSEIAVRSRGTGEELRSVNCLTNGGLQAGMKILVPVGILGQVPSAPPPALATAIPTQVWVPTATPTAPVEPTAIPPTSLPTATAGPEEPPSATATAEPTESVTATATPTVPPPTAQPTAQPTAEPTAQPTAEPTAQPTAEPTAQPTAEPTAEPPTAEPTAEPPTAEPTAVPPTAVPTAVPPTAAPPTAVPPTAEPTAAPPTAAPPTAVPPTAAQPTVQPTAEPTPDNSADGGG